MHGLSLTSCGEARTTGFKLANRSEGGISAMASLYSTKVTASGGRHGSIRSDDGLLDLKLALPRALGGRGDATNPEQLFAGGYAACFENARLHVSRDAARIWTFIDQARATGGANPAPPNDPLARSVSKKNTMMSFGSMPASSSFSTKLRRLQGLFSCRYQSPKIPALQSSTSGPSVAWVAQDSTDLP